MIRRNLAITLVGLSVVALGQFAIAEDSGAATSFRFGMNAFERGNLGDAETHLRAAIAAADGRITEQSLVCQSTFQLGVVLAEQGRFNDASTAFRRALVIYEHSPERNEIKIARTLHNLGDTELNLLRPTSAIPFLKRAISIFEKAGASEEPLLARSIGALADAYIRTNRFAEAEPMLRRAIRILEKAGGKANEQSVGLLYIILADALVAHDRVGGEAEQLYKKAIAIEQRPTHHQLTAHAIGGLAGIALWRGDLNEAMLLYQAALMEVNKSPVPLRRLETSRVLANLGLIQEELGHSAEAEALLNQAVKVQAQAVGEDHLSLIEYLEGYAKVLRSQGKNADAEKVNMRIKHIKQRK